MALINTSMIFVIGQNGQTGAHVQLHVTMDHRSDTENVTTHLLHLVEKNAMDLIEKLKNAILISVQVCLLIFTLYVSKSMTDIYKSYP